MNLRIAISIGKAGDSLKILELVPTATRRSGKTRIRGLRVTWCDRPRRQRIIQQLPVQLCLRSFRRGRAGCQNASAAIFRRRPLTIRFAHRKFSACLTHETLPAVCNCDWGGFGHVWERGNALSGKATADPKYPGKPECP